MNEWLAKDRVKEFERKTEKRQKRERWLKIKRD